MTFITVLFRNYIITNKSTDRETEFSKNQSLKCRMLLASSVTHNYQISHSALTEVACTVISKSKFRAIYIGPIFASDPKVLVLSGHPTLGSRIGFGKWRLWTTDISENMDVLGNLYLSSIMEI